MAPAIAGRWRALTKSNLDRLHDRLGPKALSSVLNDTIFTQLSAILTLAGYPDLSQEVSDELLLNLTSITKSILELRIAIGEKTLFYELEAFFHPFGIPFDPASMEDSFGSSRKSASEEMGDRQILCTTDLGLKRTVAKFVSIEQETTFEVDILLMPKVVLQSVLDDFIGTNVGSVA